MSARGMQIVGMLALVGCTGGAGGDEDSGTASTGDTAQDTVDTDTGTGSVSDTGTDSAGCPVPWAPPALVAPGCSASHTWDYGVDGVIEWRREYLYDADSRWLSMEVYDGAGTLTETQRGEYDPVTGRLARLLVDLDGDGVDDLTISYTYDASGRPLEEDFAWSTGEDQVVSYEYGPCGPAVKRWTTTDPNGSGQEHRFTYTATTRTTEVDIAGALARTEVAHYDPVTGQPTTTDIDDAGGNEHTVTYTWFPSGHLQSETTDTVAGAITSRRVEEHEYDVDGRPIRYLQTTDGLAEVEYLTVWSCP